MTILDRTNRPRIRIDTRELAESLAKRLPKADASPADRLDDAREEAAKAASDARDQAAKAASDARDQAARAAGDAADTVRHGLERAAELARGLRDDLATSAGKAGKGAESGLDDLGKRLKVDELGQRLGLDDLGHRLDDLGHRFGVDDLASRVRLDELAARLNADELGTRLKAAASPATFKALVARLERELPDTDKDRYDRAFARGRARTRTAYVAVGVGVGVGVGVVAALLLDPKHGAQRRASLKARTSRLTAGLGRTVTGKAKYASDRARGLAIEKGLVKPEGSQAAPPDVALPGSAAGAGSSADALVAVGPGRAGMASEGDVLVPGNGVGPLVETPVMPIADGPITDPSSTLREPLPEEGGAPASAEPAAEAAATSAEASLAEHDRTATPSSHG